ncbi:hypothetical protein DIPPA_23923 [Diplonema papillatum]|nr:hypothetical protein DIPPA_23923 [Diplonema papillatum]
MAAMRLVITSQNCRISVEPDIPRALHPLQIKIDGSLALGAVVGNLLLALGLLAIYDVVVVHIIGQFVEHFTMNPPADFRGLVRYPSVPLFVLLFLYQGIAWAGFILVFYPKNVTELILGIISVAFSAFVPFWVFRHVVDGISRQDKKAVYRTDSQPRSNFFLFMLGPGEWVSTHRQKQWVFRYSSLMLAFKEKLAFWGAIDMLASLALAALSALPVSGNMACGHVKLISAGVLLTLLFAESYYLPYHKVRDNVVIPSVIILQIVEVALLGVTAYSNDVQHWSTPLASVLVYLTVGLLVLKGILDLVGETWLLINGRRDLLQQEQWAEADKNQELLPMEEAHSSKAGSAHKRGTSSSVVSDDGHPSFADCSSEQDDYGSSVVGRACLNPGPVFSNGSIRSPTSVVLMPLSPPGPPGALLLSPSTSCVPPPRKSFPPTRMSTALYENEDLHHVANRRKSLSSASRRPDSEEISFPVSRQLFEPAHNVSALSSPATSMPLSPSMSSRQATRTRPPIGPPASRRSSQAFLFTNAQSRALRGAAVRSSLQT